MTSLSDNTALTWPGYLAPGFSCYAVLVADHCTFTVSGDSVQCCSLWASLDLSIISMRDLWLPEALCCSGPCSINYLSELSAIRWSPNCPQEDFKSRPLCWDEISSIFPSPHFQVCVLTLSSNIVGIICSVLTPYMLNPGAWNWGNYAGFFWVRSSPHVSIV